MVNKIITLSLIYQITIKHNTMTKQIVPNKPISKMSKLEVVRFINSLAPLLNHYSRSTRGSRVIAENLYQQYLNGQAMPVRKSLNF